MIDMSKRPASGTPTFLDTVQGLRPSKAPKIRVSPHSQARIKPLDAYTLHEASTCLVYEGGQVVAQLKRCGQRCWGVYPTGMTTPSAFGASALEAVTTWLSARDAGRGDA